jgi:hypothetical protein
VLYQLSYLGKKADHMVGPRAGDEIRTHDLLLGKEMFYH